MGTENLTINDTIFQQAVSCPLKFVHFRDFPTEKYKSLPFKQRNKLKLRNAVALQFENLKFTSDETKKAELETDLWLKDENVTICGAVIRVDNFLTRIPILEKKKDKFTVVQIHGKLRKRTQLNSIHQSGVNRTTDRYLLKAAYRTEILQQKFPESDIQSRFFFPVKNFRSQSANLFASVSFVTRVDGKIRDELSQLFAEVDATDGVKQVLKSIPKAISHPVFAGKSVSETILMLNTYPNDTANPFDVRIHSGCGNCDFRKTSVNQESGCWERFFGDDVISESAPHIFELIGHGNHEEAEKGHFYQQQVSIDDYYQSFESIQQAGGSTINIQQRRLMQLLKLKEENTPQIWIKPGLTALGNLEFPLHFIDFEASTYAIPMKRGDGPYDPVYFQFSCHTLKRDGSVNHTEWLDDTDSQEHPHSDFVQNLAKIADFGKGTFIQYSPFESQALHTILRDFDRNSMLWEQEIEIIKKLLYSSVHTGNHRFFDLSKLIRDTYYNCYFEDGLSLKQVLSAILKLHQLPEKSLLVDRVQKENDDELFDIFKENKGSNPYKEIQLPGYNIENGSDAMNAYISMKSQRVSKEEKQNIDVIMRKYCALDSYALVIIYRHLYSFLEQVKPGNDLVIFKN